MYLYIETTLSVLKSIAFLVFIIICKKYRARRKTKKKLPWLFLSEVTFFHNPHQIIVLCSHLECATNNHRFLLQHPPCLKGVLWVLEIAMNLWISYKIKLRIKAGIRIFISFSGLWEILLKRVLLLRLSLKTKKWFNVSFLINIIYKRKVMIESNKKSWRSVRK